MERQNIQQDGQPEPLIQQAKAFLIRRYGMTEPQAHRFIGKQAMDHCVTRQAVAEAILRAASR